MYRNIYIFYFLMNTMLIFSNLNFFRDDNLMTSSQYTFREQTLFTYILLNILILSLICLLDFNVFKNIKVLISILFIAIGVWSGATILAGNGSTYEGLLVDYLDGDFDNDRLTDDYEKLIGSNMYKSDNLGHVYIADISHLIPSKYIDKIINLQIEITGTGTFTDISYELIEKSTNKLLLTLVTDTDVLDLVSSIRLVIKLEDGLTEDDILFVNSDEVLPLDIYKLNKYQQNKLCLTISKDMMESQSSSGYIQEFSSLLLLNMN